ncbi:MAG: hypothetical protein FWF59_00925 [Turicibacter sp.]|nr:hypothetical protein [Turicibacter sp.]
MNIKFKKLYDFLNIPNKVVLNFLKSENLNPSEIDKLAKPQKAPKLGSEKFRTAKSIIERDEHGIVAKIILRDVYWPYYKSSAVGSKEWIIEGDSIKITRAEKKQGFVSETLNFSDITLFSVEQGKTYIGKIRLESKNTKGHRFFPYNQFDCLAALAAGQYVRDHCQDKINEGSLKVELDQMLIDFRTLLDAGDPETLKMVEYRKMPH